MCVCVCYVGENKKEREIGGERKNECRLREALSIFKHVAAQVSVQASPSHELHLHDAFNPDPDPD